MGGNLKKMVVNQKVDIFLWSMPEDLLHYVDEWIVREGFLASV